MEKEVRVVDVLIYILAGALFEGVFFFIPYLTSRAYPDICDMMRVDAGHAEIISFVLMGFAIVSLFVQKATVDAAHTAFKYGIALLTAQITMVVASVIEALYSTAPKYYVSTYQGVHMTSQAIAYLAAYIIIFFIMLTELKNYKTWMKIFAVVFSLPMIALAVFNIWLVIRIITIAL
ncbi:hypothetical protein [Butyrivibrio proteoclasticus]|uniref:hypothetical protein n=1 Tax=Butyrivibrio proteoclasticus TaxID=43305 RepID=UPI00047C75C1|nr:hypothetical protein [Butyrivibrio proteoclasticus]